MRYLTPNEVVELHRRLIHQFGGSSGMRDMSALESAIAQPRITFGGEDLYPTVIEKAVALGFSIVNNHPFVDGNKRAGHAAMEVFLVFNGYEIDASTDEQESIVLKVASGKLGRGEFTDWLRLHLVERR